MPDSTGKLRFAIVGCGVIHGTHVKAIRAQGDAAELVAVCDEDPAKAQAAAEKAGVPFYTDLAEMLEKQPFDVLNVCTPSGLHAKHGIMGANAGKHIVCEKPIDVSLEAADALIEACAKSGVKLEVISQSRYSSGMQQLKRWQNEGKLGKLCYAESVTKWYRSQKYYDSGGWRGTWELDGGGALMNQGVHYVDQLRWIMGPVKSVAATMATRAHERIEVEDVVSASIEFENGAVGTLIASTDLYPGFHQGLEVYGTGGSVVVEADKLKFAQFAPSDGGSAGAYGGTSEAPLVKDYQWREDAAPATTSDTSTDTASAGASTASDPAAVSLGGHAAHIRDLIDAIHMGREPFMNGQEARNALELIIGVYRSARSGERIHFPLK